MGDYELPAEPAFSYCVTGHTQTPAGFCEGGCHVKETNRPAVAGLLGIHLLPLWGPWSIQLSGAKHVRTLSLERGDGTTHTLLRLRWPLLRFSGAAGWPRSGRNRENCTCGASRI